MGITSRVAASSKDEAILLIGWDAAVDPRNTALCKARYRDGDGGASRMLWIESYAAPHDHEELLNTVIAWASEDAPVLLCVDSPLGWPVEMGSFLSAHRAGAGIPASADHIFRRITDLDVRRRVGKTPLDVGADRIARTALATLNEIEAMRLRISRSIEVPTDIRDPRDERSQILLLESYPAGWFASERIVTRGYRPTGGGERRRGLLNEVERRLEERGVSIRYGVDRELFLRRADDLDALVCTLSGIDYLRGRCPAPEPHHRETVRREGWIWCKDRY